MEQISLYPEEKNIVRNKETNKVKRIVEKSQDESYCIGVIKNDQYLWDMRAWSNYKDIEEVEAWVKNSNGDKNCGHVAWCIRLLHDMDVSSKTIVEAIMENPHIQYKNRIVRCFDQPTACKFYSKKNGYANCPCTKCE